MKMTLWGAGGGGSMPATLGSATYSAGGGAGGFAEGIVPVTAGSNLTITVGSGGVATGTARRYGGGGAGAPGRNDSSTANPQSNGSSGGGMSAVWNGTENVAANALLIAGGGGGAAFWTDQPVGSEPWTGGGGGTSGSNSGTPYGGAGGTPTAGGAFGGPSNKCRQSVVGFNSTGSQFQGGDGCSGILDSSGQPNINTPFEYEGGGGGGGGWYGGGGGAGQNENNPVNGNPYDGPGGGGSGYLAATVTSGTLNYGDYGTYGNTANPPQTASSLYSSGVGVGGVYKAAQNAVAGNGEVILQYALAKLNLQKALPKGRFAASDQFVLSMTGATSVTTTGTDTSGVGSVTSAAVSNNNATVGTVYTLSEEAAGTTNLSNYTTTYACTNALSGGQTPSGTGTSFTVTPVAGDNLSCTFTNTRKSATLTLKKTWSSGSTANDKINIPATTGFINNTALLSSTAAAAGNTTTGTAVTVYAGESGTLGAESFTTGIPANYNATLACTGNSMALNGNTLTITAADTAITCTYTNTRLPLLSVTKTSNGPWPIGQTGAIYTLTPSNAGKTATSSPPAVTVIDVLPSGITANWPNPLNTNGWICTFTGQTVTCTSSATIAAGANGTNIVLPVNVVGPAGTVTNYASIGGGGDLRNGGVAPTPGASCTPTGMCTSVTTTILALDYGEDPTSAPGTLSGNSYKTLLAETPSGARHGIVAGVRLGATEVADTDGTPVTFGSDITASDNDGVTFNGNSNKVLTMSVTGPKSNTVVVNASVAGYINAWIDFDQNGLFDASEKLVLTNTTATSLANDMPVVVGNNTLTFNAPATTITGLTYARFRFTTSSGVATTSTGLASDGEVEDYAVKFTNVLSPTSCVSSPVTTIGFNLRWFDAASSTTTYRLYQRVGTLPDGTLVDMAFSSSSAVTYSSSTGVTTQPLPGNQSVNNGYYKSSIYTTKFYKSGTSTPVSMGIINLLTDIDGVSGSLGESAGAPAPAPIGANTSEHVAWHTNQVYEAQYSSNAQLYLSANPFTAMGRTVFEVRGDDPPKMGL